MVWSWPEKGCFLVLCRNSARPAYAPAVPPKKARLSKVPSEIRHAPASAFALSIPKAAKARKFIATSAVTMLAGVR